MIIPGILESASRFHLPIDRLTMREAENRFPLIRGETAGFPCFFFETPGGCFYGFPEPDSMGLKVAWHSGGQRAVVSEDGLHPRDAEDQRSVESFLREHLPAVSLELTRTEGCYYTMSPDEHFIVDRLPDAPQVT